MDTKTMGVIAVTPRKFVNQIAGRSKIEKILGDHLIKTTNEFEIASYLKMKANISEWAPQVCFLISNGKLFSNKECKNCETLSKIQRENLRSAHSSGYFLIMKDLTHGMRNPRLLDLKLGTRTHSDHLAEEKKAERILKALTTTSATIGLRLSGASFQEPEHPSKTIIMKAEGREMTVAQFTSVMDRFFDIHTRQRMIVMEKLAGIKNAIEKSEKLRFFGASILIIVEDEVYETDSPIDKGVVVKLIDFASQARSEYGKPQYTGPDDGALLGLTSMINILKI